MLHIKDPVYSQEAAQRLGVSTATLSRWRSSGRLKGIPTGPARNAPMVFEREDVERLRGALEVLGKLEATA